MVAKTKTTQTKSHQAVSRSHTMRSIMIVSFVGIVFVASTFFVWDSVSRNVLADARSAFNRDVEDVSAAIKLRVSRDVYLLTSLQALFNASQAVERSEFYAYTDTLQLPTNYPGIYALGYTKLVSSDAKDAFVQQVRSDASVQPGGYPNFTIYPDTTKQVYKVITYSYPEATTITGLGFDMSTDAVRNEALQRAQSTNAPAATSVVRLVTDHDPAILIFSPIFKKASSMPPNEQGQFLGWVNATLKINQFFPQIKNGIDVDWDNFDLDVYDATAGNASTGPTLLYDYSSVNQGSGSKAGLVETRSIMVAGKTWSLNFWGSDHYGLNDVEGFLPFVTLVVGLLLSLIMCLLFYSILNSRFRAQHLAERMTHDLEKFKLAVENASDHIVITDADGIILYANKAVQRITGFDPKDVIGKKAGGKDTWGGLMDVKVYEKLWRTIKKEKRVFIGALKNRRKNGELYDVIASVSPILSKNKSVEFFVGIERDVTIERNIDRTKTEFVSLASHQLRTPLSAINWYAEMLMDGDVGTLNKEQKEYVDEIAKGNQRMIELVNALLNVSRLELGTFVVEPVPTDLVAIADNVLKELDVKVKEKNMKVIRNYQRKLPKINVDPKLMRIVFQNLLSNALKYTPAKGTVTFGITKDSKQFAITIADTGYGIPEESKKHIFSKLYRADNVKIKDVEGTGLGLYIVKAIIDQSGGKVWFTSEENKGTTFYVTLPMAGMAKKSGTKSLS